MARAFMSREDFPGAGPNTLYAGDFGAILRRTLYIAMATHNAYKYHEKHKGNIPGFKSEFQELMQSLVSDAEKEPSLEKSMKRHLSNFLRKGLAANWESHAHVSGLTYSGMDYQNHMERCHMKDRHTSDLVSF